MDFRSPLPVLFLRASMVVHTGDHHWELELCKAAYINEMTSSKYTQLYAFWLLVPIAGKDNQLKKVCSYMKLWAHV